MNMNENKTDSQGRQPTLRAKEIVRVKEVVTAVGLSRATIYRLMEKFQFPQKVKISQGLVGWRIDEVNQFIELGPDGWYEQFGKAQEQEV